MDRILVLSIKRVLSVTRRCAISSTLNFNVLGLNLVNNYSTSQFQAQESEDIDSEQVKVVIDEIKDDPANLVKNLGISPLLKKYLVKRNVNTLFPIQTECFLHIVSGRDLVGRVRTSTGKTMAFALPIIEKLERLGPHHTKLPRVLILAPTRELASQVEKEIAQLAGTSYKTLCIYGGSAYGPQDIVVGTPGRVQDMINKGILKLSEINILCLDEADHMLDIGFAEDLDKILALLRDQQSKLTPSTSGSEAADKFQFLLFSATIPDWIKKTIRKYLKKDYITIDQVGDDVMKASKAVRHLSIPTTYRQITSTIVGLLQTYRTTNGRSIIFCQTKASCDTLAYFLNKINGINPLVLHGDVSQAVREQALSKFREGNVTCLVATDVAARGLDISNVELVIQSEAPNDPETYIHRSGRTGRAGKTGVCITLFDFEKDQEIMERISKVAGVDFVIVSPPTEQDIARINIRNFLGTLSDIHINKLERTQKILKGIMEQLPPHFQDHNKLIAATFLMYRNQQSSSALITPRSSLNGEENFTTMVAVHTNRTTDIANTLYNTFNLDPEIVSLKRPTPFLSETGIAFDVNPSVVEAILAKQEEIHVGSGIRFDVAKELPLLEKNKDFLKLHYRMNKKQLNSTSTLTGRYNRKSSNIGSGDENQNRNNYGSSRDFGRTESQSRNSNRDSKFGINNFEGRISKNNFSRSRNNNRW